MCDARRRTSIKMEWKSYQITLAITISKYGNVHLKI
jgi:hypothetical protein